jgi:hypothetical protein
MILMEHNQLMLCLNSKLISSFYRLENDPCSSCMPSTTETIDSHAQVCLVCLHNTTPFSYWTFFSLLLALAIGGTTVDIYSLAY